MDRRTVLAFVLIFLVYVGWMQLYKRWYKPAESSPAPAPAEVTVADPDRDAAAAAANATRPTTVDLPPVEPSPAPTAATADPLRFVPPASDAGPLRVTTDLYELVIDPVGARVVEWRGLKFRGPDGEPVQLVPSSERGAVADAGDRLVFERGQLDLSLVAFAHDAPAQVRLGASDDARSVAFEATTEAGLVVRKTYTFRPDRYAVDVDLEATPRDETAWAVAAAALGRPERVRFAWPAGIASTERNQKMERDSFRAVALVGEEMIVKHRRDVGRDGARVRADLSGSVRFAAVQNKYFIVAGYVPQAAEGRALEGSVHLDRDTASGGQSWWIELPLVSRGAGLPTGGRIGLYLGPAQYERLASYGVGLEKSVDLGWKLFQPLAAITLRFMNWLYRWIPNYGVVIILLSIFVKVAFYPLTRSSTRSMKRMQELAPRMKALQEKHKGNQQKLSEEMMKLYKEEKINPMGGCLPMLLQMPVFIALYQVLRADIGLRQAPFTLWIRDLGQPDALFTLPFSIPFLGNEFNVLPLLMAASTYWQMKLTPTSPGAGPSMQMINKLMPVMMLFFFYTFPSGLVLYWLVMNLVSIYQTWRIHTTTPATGGAQA